MKVVNAGYKILTPIDGQKALKAIETVARTCYKSERNIKEGSAEKMVAALVRNGHEAMLEHFFFTVKFVVDRGISHEIVRHRLASFAQESTRYCNYSKDEFQGEITVVKPLFLTEGTDAFNVWKKACQTAESCYFSMLNSGCAPQEARCVLPTCLKTEICMTANLREWRWFFKLRAANYAGKAHPQIREVAVPLLGEIKKIIPIVFDDIIIRDE